MAPTRLKNAVVQTVLAQKLLVWLEIAPLLMYKRQMLLYAKGLSLPVTLCEVFALNQIEYPTASNNKNAPPRHVI